MKKHSLVSKLLVAFSLTIGISFVVIATMISLWFQDYYFNDRKKRLDNETKLIEEFVISYIDEEVNKNELDNAIEIMSNSLGTDLLITDKIGYIYAVSDEQYKEIKFKKIQSMENMDFERLISGNTLEYRTDTDYVYCKPIIGKNGFSGVMMMVTPIKQIAEPLKKIYTVIWASVILTLIFSSIILYFIAEKIIVSPLGKISTASKRLAQGETYKTIEIKSNDEVGELADSFNKMAMSLEAVEKNRREFISNASHELRSPITSMKGFIAGILDGVIPRDKENYYLKIVYDEIERLTRLINDLLDLSTMEAGKLKLNTSELDINDLIQVCTINMEQKIIKKNCNVEVSLEGKRLYVKADRDRIMQVVTNIIDNAIKYSNENGNIEISTKSKGDKVLISIFNDGPMLSHEELRYIWDRFYKSDKSRTNKESTGLGLSIVRNIIHQHGEDIQVENDETRNGVEFSFTLSKAN